jgi:hypothetical protein
MTNFNAASTPIPTPTSTRSVDLSERHQLVRRPDGVTSDWVGEDPPAAASVYYQNYLLRGAVRAQLHATLVARTAGVDRRRGELLRPRRLAARRCDGTRWSRHRQPLLSCTPRPGH